MSQEITQFHIDALNQLANGPSLVAVYHSKDAYFSQLDLPVALGLLEDVSRKVFIDKTSQNFRAVMITETGISFCRNSGSNMVN